MHYIYLIKNLINGKNYIGQTINPTTRFNSYKLASSKGGNRPIEYAFKKYGFDNFEFSIIDQVNTQNEADEKEKFYIREYHSLITENGYNITKGGKGYDGKTPFHSQEEWKIIKEEIKTDLFHSLQEIADRHQLSLPMLKKVNQGKALYDETEKYPLRKLKSYEYKAIEIKNLLINSNKSFSEIAEITNSSITTVQYINSGKIRKDNKLSYPLRKAF